MHPATILALSMNGQTPAIHGFPVRLIVPGWDGTSWVKWVTRIRRRRRANTGFFMNPGYRYPKYALPPGTPAKPAELEVIEGMPVKSSITAPEDQAKTALGPMTIRGFAWAGEERHRARGGLHRWRQPLARGATLLAQTALRLAIVAAWSGSPREPGYYTIMSRATDTAGRVQPIVSPWNPSGYLWNAIDRVGVTVEKSA